VLTSNPTKPFWRQKSLAEMTRSEWEALCDGCGRCCLQKYENKKTGKVKYTCVSCYLLDIQTCRCKDYGERTRLVPDCEVIRPANIHKLRWLPKTCAYRRLAAGKDLADWHPLISGSVETIHGSGISVRSFARSEESVHPDDVEASIMDAFL